MQPVTKKDLSQLRSELTQSITIRIGFMLAMSVAVIVYQFARKAPAFRPGMDSADGAAVL